MDKKKVSGRKRKKNEEDETIPEKKHESPFDEICIFVPYSCLTTFLEKICDGKNIPEKVKQDRAVFGEYILDKRLTKLMYEDVENVS